jgi:hypothetical protein
LKTGLENIGSALKGDHHRGVNDTAEITTTKSKDISAQVTLHLHGVNDSSKSSKIIS